MSVYGKKQYWIDLGERAVTTFAQVFGALAIVSSPMDLISLDWGGIATASGIAAGLSVVKSLAVAPIGADNASLAGRAIESPAENHTQRSGSLAG